MLWVTEDTVCMWKNFSFLKEESLLKLNTKTNGVAIQQSRVSHTKRDPKAIRWIWRLRQTLLLFCQAVLKGNFWISPFVQCSGMQHLVHIQFESRSVSQILVMGMDDRENLGPKLCVAGSDLKELVEKEALQHGYHHH